MGAGCRNRMRQGRLPQPYSLQSFRNSGKEARKPQRSKTPERVPPTSFADYEPAPDGSLGQGAKVATLRINGDVADLWGRLFRRSLLEGGSFWEMLSCSFAAYVYIYIYICMHIHTCVHIYIH